MAHHPLPPQQAERCRRRPGHEIVEVSRHYDVGLRRRRRAWWNRRRGRAFDGGGIARLDFFPRGSLVERTTRCGTPTCRYRTDPDRQHGPYPSWIRKVGPRTVTKTLSASQAEQYRPSFDNARRLRACELEALSVEVITHGEGWDKGTR